MNLSLQSIEERIKAAYPDAKLIVEDHAGDLSKIYIECQTPAFQGLNRVKQHQALMALFQNELQSGRIHAMTLKTSGE